VNFEDAVRAVEGGAEIRLFCQPKAARTAIVGLHGGAVKVKVHAPALEGRANDALLALLASVLELPKGRLSLVAGPHSRWKRVVASGVDAGDVAARLEGAVETPERR
jgi:uncharacterized protein